MSGRKQQKQMSADRMAFHMAGEEEQQEITLEVHFQVYMEVFTARQEVWIFFVNRELVRFLNMQLMYQSYSQSQVS